MLTRLRSTAVGAAGVMTLALVIAGCNNGSKGNESTPPPGASQNAAPPPSGAKQTAQAPAQTPAQMFAANGCGRCHRLGATGGGRAPDLTHTGAESTHTAQWLADQIKNPRSHNPNSRMPAYQGRMSDKDIETLAKYLADQK